MDIENIVNGVNFKRISNIVIDLDTVHEKRFYNKKNIIFCKTDLLGILFNEIDNTDTKNILISHQSDYEISKDIFLNKPSNILRWYAQNVNFQDDDLIPLPIGIENHFGPSKGTLIDLDFLSNFNPSYEFKDKICNKIYCNFNVGTHVNRKNVYNYLTENNLVDVGNFGTSNKEFLEILSKYLFIASPRGNGIDCHRTWETMIMGSIPIVEKHFMYDTYKNLPILQISSWEDLINTNILEDYKEKYLNNELFNNLQEITMDFWIDKILKEFALI
jgi:hypothetical protein